MLSGNTVKYIQSLTHKKFRDQYRRFIAETPKVVEEFLSAGYEVDSIYATEEWMITKKEKATDDNGNWIAVRDFELKKISQLKTPREVVGVFHIPDLALPGNLDGKITLALDDIQDPGNVGTIIRIADWFNIQHILCSLHTAQAYSPKVVQATMGSLAHVKMHYVDLKDFLSKSKLPLYATSLQGDSVFETGTIDEGILIIGNEGKGISSELLSLAGNHLTIPRLGRAESLNAAMATGIILSHIVKV